MNLYDLHPDPENAPYREWAFENIPELVWEKYAFQPAEIKKREKVLAKDAQYAYLYAKLVLKGPFPAGEPVIAKDPRHAYNYARYALIGRFPAGEVTIRGSGWSTAYSEFIAFLSLKSKGSGV